MSFPSEFLEDKYEVLSKIREGGMGEIYKVRHRLLDEVRVIKLIRQKHAHDPDLRRRFEQEARTAIQLRHPGIAQIHDLAVAPDDTAVIVMEWIDGFSLQDLLRRGLPDLGLVIEVAEQGLDALEFLHRKGYVHRDISPDNLMLTRGHDGRPRVKLIDLGITKRLGPTGGIKTATGMFLGKARYSSPEQFGHGEIGPWSDVYSFGVMLYELLTGVRPVTGEELTELVASHLFRPPLAFSETDPSGRVPVELREVVMHTLAKKPEERIRSAAELAGGISPFRRPFPSPFEGDATMIEPSVTAPTGASKPPLATAAEATVPAGTLAEATVRMPGTAVPVARDEPSTVVTAPGVRPARRAWVGLLGAAALVAIVALAFVGYRGWLSKTSPLEEYRQGVLAVRDGDWAAATSHIRAAVEGEPRSSTKPVVVGEGDSVPYLPYYFLGRSLFEMRNYVLALRAWKQAEAEGVVQGTPEYSELVADRARVIEILRQELDKADLDLKAVDDFAKTLSSMLTDEDLARFWAGEPELRDRIRRTLEEHQSLAGQVEKLRAGGADLSDPQTATTLLDVRSRANKLRPQFTELANQYSDARERLQPVE